MRSGGWGKEEGSRGSGSAPFATTQCKKESAARDVFMAGFKPALPPETSISLSAALGVEAGRLSELQGLKPFVYCAAVAGLKPRPPRSLKFVEGSKEGDSHELRCAVLVSSRCESFVRRRSWRAEGLLGIGHPPFRSAVASAE